MIDRKISPVWDTEDAAEFLVSRMTPEERQAFRGDDRESWVEGVLFQNDICIGWTSILFVCMAIEDELEENYGINPWYYLTPTTQETTKHGDQD